MKKIVSLFLVVSMILTMSFAFADDQVSTQDPLEAKVEMYLESFDEDSSEKLMFIRELELLQTYYTYNEETVDELYNRYRPIDVSELSIIEPEEVVIEDETVDESTVIRVTPEEAEQNQLENELILSAYEEMLEGITYEEALSLGFDETIVAQIELEEIQDTEAGEIVDLSQSASIYSITSQQTSNSANTISKAPMVVSGNYHNVYLRADGTVWTWGRQDSYAGLKPTMDTYTVPTKIESLSSIIEVAAYGDYSLALSSIGVVFAWGHFTKSGVGSRDPIIVQGLSDIVSIDVGSNKSIALKSDGTVYEWTNGQFYAEQVMTNANTPLTNVKAVAAGNYSRYALKSDGTVLSWGTDYQGSLGTGGAYSSTIYPVNVVDVTGTGVLSDIIAISASSHVLALKSDGTVVAWGARTGIGQNLTENVTYPMIVKDWTATNAVTNVISVHTGPCNSAIITNDGRLYIWGDNEYLTGDTYIVQFPTLEQNIFNVVSVSMGNRHIVAVKNDGSIWAIGHNSEYQLGIGRKYSESVQQMYNMSDVIQIDSLGDYSAAVKSDGTVWTWGRNHNGQLGDGTTQDSSMPVQVLDTNGAPLTDVVMVKVCESFSFALKSDGTVWSWGLRVVGSLGNKVGDSLRRAAPVCKNETGYPILENIVSIEAGGYYGMALDGEGYVWSWGWGAAGRLGLGNEDSKDYANRITTLSDITEISCGTSHAMALDSNKEVWCWGYNPRGQVGDGTTQTRLSPVKVEGVQNIKSISAGDSSSMALGEDGTIWAWGGNVDGELGDGTKTDRTTPVHLSLTNIEEINLGYKHVLALDVNGTVWAWGNNSSGQVTGSPTTSDVTTPIQVETEEGLLENVSSIAGGFAHSLALKNSGTVWCWGDNQYGQLGDGRQLIQMDWLCVMNTMPSIIQVSSKEYHSIVLKSDGTVWTSGQNNYGQIGVGTVNATVTVPQRVKGVDGIGYLDDIVAIEAGFKSSYALESDGNVLAWGHNEYGKLGQPSTLPYTYTPMYVKNTDGTGILTDIIAIAAGKYHCLALSSDGTVYAWGDNSQGQLGNGTGLSSDYPVVVNGLTDIIAISSYGSHSLALKSDGTVYAWGQNDMGQVGTGNTSTYVGIPTPVMTSSSQPLSGVTKISAGYVHNVVLKNDGTVWTWGHNDFGQLGNNTTNESYYAIMVPSLTDVSAVSAGSYSSYAIIQTSSLKAWGQNTDGKLGNNAYTNKLTPVTVQSSTNVKSVDGSWNFTAQITTPGVLKMCGINSHGQFGIGTVEDTSATPINAYTTGITYNDYGSSFETATNIQVNKIVTGEINASNNDYFIFTADFTGAHTIETTGGITISVYNSDGYYVTPVNDAYSLTKDASYYVVVSKDSTASYTFIIRSQNPAPYFARHSFKSGFINPVAITKLVPGYVEGTFVVANDYSEDKDVLVVLILMKKEDNEYHEIALVEKTLPAKTSESITLGLTVPQDSENYQLKAIIWDGRTTMNQLGSDIIFK